ncbi:Alpha-ketoglutarate-dependent sulfonate dioxygenase [Saitozyma sp. JCM 24511]|nr:Alpha-ketoglutarate-dependent sulfonate dioxygenase [Saitozyma sp. JCM 24511]
MSYGKTLTEMIASPEEVAKNVARLRLVGANGPEGGVNAMYPAYLPVWEKSKLPDWEAVPYVDPGTRATPDKRNLFVAGSMHREITPAIGEEIWGVQLSQLSKEGLDDLALLAAERGLLIFRDQEFKDIGPERQLDTVRHFGRLHIHPTMGHPEGYPEMHVVYRDPKDSTIARYTKPNEVSSISSVNWHVDHTAEVQPPGITFFFGLEVPPSGGDTLFVSATEAYNRLSDEFKTRLEGLQVVHDNTDMLTHSASLGGPCRFSPQKRNHPLIRTHPVTKQKILSIHQAHARRIFGYKKEESEYLFSFLNDVLIKGGDFQTRAHYEPGTVVVWDNRVVAHTATYDFKGDERRHMVRIAAMADVPV